VSGKKTKALGDCGRFGDRFKVKEKILLTFTFFISFVKCNSLFAKRPRSLSEDRSSTAFEEKHLKKTKSKVKREY